MYVGYSEAKCVYTGTSLFLYSVHYIRMKHMHAIGIGTIVRMRVRCALCIKFTTHYAKFAIPRKWEGPWPLRPPTVLMLVHVPVVFCPIYLKIMQKDFNEVNNHIHLKIV